MPTFEIHPLRDDLPFGARVTGVTSALLKDPPIRAQLNQLFEDCGVIVFEGVENSAAMQTEISEVFGPLKEHPVASVDRADADNLKGVIAISAGEHMAIVEIDGKPLVTWQPWHFDHAYNDELNRAGVLRPVIIASEGGKTGFACGIQIYNDMDPAIRAKMEGASPPLQSRPALYPPAVRPAQELPPDPLSREQAARDYRRAILVRSTRHVDPSDRRKGVPHDRLWLPRLQWRQERYRLPDAGGNLARGDAGDQALLS